MDRQTYRRIEDYMRDCMGDSAHDCEHVRRVLYAALDIAAHEPEPVDFDVLTAACLLHDIGRQEQFRNPRLCHAAVGAEKARRYLLENGFAEPFAGAVADCIRAHRFRSDSPPQSVEAKILFDADKLDVTGATGIARTLFYQGQAGDPLYTLRPDGRISDGAGDARPSFFREYKFKLEKLYTKFYTRRGAALAAERQAAAAAFYRSLLSEARSCCDTGGELLEKHVFPAGA